jgi:aspartate/methionine/tyrosine aminotransferase
MAAASGGAGLTSRIQALEKELRELRALGSPAGNAPAAITPAASVVLALLARVRAREAAARWDLSSTGMGALTLVELQQRGLAVPDFAQVGLGYGALSGSLALRTALAGHYYAGNLQTILVTQGAIEANLLAISALLEPGDQVVTFTPGYQQFKSWPEFLGATVIQWPLTDLYSPEDFAPELTFLANLEDLPKLIILNNPHNPTGKCFSPTWLAQLIHWCAQRGVWLLCDEVYRDLQLGGPYRKPSLADFGYERIVVTSSFSKSFWLLILKVFFRYNFSNSGG